MNGKKMNVTNNDVQGGVNRREFLSSIGMTAGGVAAAVSLLPIVASKPAMAQFGSPSPFDTKERDRRWALVRGMMKAEGLDVLVVPHGGGDDYHKYAGYLSETGFFRPGLVMFPLQGEPVQFGGAPNPRWISDFQAGHDHTIGEALIARLKASGYENKTIGVIGTEARVFGLNEFSGQGLMLYSIWNEVIESLPNAKFKDITSIMAETIMVKGEEEIKAHEAAALFGEDLHKLMLKEIKPGMTDRHVRALVSEYIIMNGADTNVKALQMKPGVIADGDVINAEYGINYKGGYTQVTLCIAVGKVSKQTEELRKVAKESLELGLSLVKPGIAFAEAIDPMEKLVTDAGYWHGFPQIHGLNPIILVGPVGYPPFPATYSKTLGGDIVLKAGMTLSFEPGARKGMVAQVKIGGSGIVTETGFKMFNTLGLNLQRI